jgi:ribonuclease P protein component
VDGNTPNTLPKQERLCGKRGIDRLLAHGRHGNVGALRYRYLSDNGEEKSRILVSVPKKLFKRAVKRNLLKRRIRESWRRLKHGLQTEKHMDVLIIYSTKEVLTYQEIYECIERVIERLNGTQKSNEKSE